MLTDRDYELLSAYLDDALISPERTALEARLQKETELRTELEALRATVNLVSNLPVYRAPRNFKLDARFARRSTGRWLVFPTSTAFSTLSAAAAVLLIAVSSILLTRNNALQTLNDVLGGQAAQEQQLAFAPTEADENSQKTSRAELEATGTALSSTVIGDDTILNEALAATSLPQPSAAGEITGAAAPPVAQEGAGQAADTQPLPTQTTQPTQHLFAAPLQGTIAATGAAFSSMAQATDMPQDGALFFGLAQEEEPTEAEDGSANSAASGAAAADSANIAVPSTPTLTTTPTAAPTAVAVLPTEPGTLDRVRDQQSVSDPLPLLLLAVGLVLLGIAVSTSLARWRNR